MTHLEDIMVSLDEISIIPEITTEVESRSEVVPYYGDKLPIFVAPMTCIIDSSNIELFNNSKVTPILPRGNKWNKNTDYWIALSLKEFEEHLNKRTLPKKVLIDVANGHMTKIYALAERCKEKMPEVQLMVGNIANPYIYKTCCDLGIDYVRVGIGGGSACSTSALTGVHASLPWLLSKINKIKLTYDNPTKVIADGGINTIDKAIKCLALGADYVMMGKLFAQCEEACGKTYDINGCMMRDYYGMASVRGAKDLGKKVTELTAEGIGKLVPVTNTLNNLTNRIEASLRSAMSYCNAPSLAFFIGGPQILIQTINEFKSYYK